LAIASSHLLKTAFDESVEKGFYINACYTYFFLKFNMDVLSVVHLQNY